MSDRLARSLPVVLLLGLVIVYGHSAWLHPTEQALGAVGSEAPGHLWGLWIVIDSLWQQGPFVRSAAGVGFPGGFTAHLMDPVNLLPFGLGYLLGGGGVSGAVLGWNLLHLVAIALAGWGALRCVDLLVTREHPARPAVGLLLVAVIGGGSFLFAHPLLGRTEFLPGVLLPHLLADLLPGVQEGDRWRLLRAGLCLGAIALGGAYLAAFVGLTLLPVGLALLVRAHDKPARLLRLVAVAALGLLLWSPAGLALDAHPPRGQVSIWDSSLVMREPGPLWALSSLVRVGPEEALRTSLDPPAYLGLVAVGLALFGLLRDPRRVGPWVALAAWLTALAMGSTVSTGPGPGALTLLLPVSLLDRLVPALYNIKSWGRLGIFLPVPIGLAAAGGLLQLGRRLPARGLTLLALGLSALILVDQATWPRPDTLPRPTFGARQPAALGALLDRLPPGPIIPLPFELPLGRGELLEAGQWQLWRMQHGRPISASPEAITDVTLRTSFASQLLATRQLFGDHRKGRMASQVFKPEYAAEQAACARRDLPALIEQGFVAFVLWGERAGASSVKADLRAWFGEPTEVEGAAEAWVLGALRAEPGGPCPPPPQHSQVRLVLMVDAEGALPPR